MVCSSTWQISAVASGHMPVSLLWPQKLLFVSFPHAAAWLPLALMENFMESTPVPGAPFPVPLTSPPMCLGC